MKISVIIPTFNRSNVVRRAIDSVLLQTYKNFELIIVDDGSTDDTHDILKDYIVSERIIYVRSENKGVSAARNLGVSLSNGEYISFLDSDDEWLPCKLQMQIDLIKQGPELECVHGEEIWIRNAKRVNQKKIHQKFGGDIFEKCLGLCLISPSAVMISKRLYTEMNGFDEDYIVCEDYDLWLKITSLYKVGFIKEPIITKYGGHDDQLSAKYFAMDYYRVKSMDRILKIRDLSNERVSLVKETIVKKASILLKGYEKHNNMKDHAEILEILESHLES
jgi:glycosyltransferase involved in cell wall biosynthesis